MLVTFKMITLLIVFCFVSLCTGNMAGGNTEPTFVLNFDSSLHVCADPDSIALVDTSGVEVVYYNETFSYLNGNMIFQKGLGGEFITVLVTGHKEVSGQFEIMFNHEICNFCQELHDGSDYFKYLKFFGFPDECPFPAGDYPIRNFVPDSEDLPVNSSNEGRYQIMVSFFSSPDGSCNDDNEFLMCFKLSFVIERME